MRHTYFTLGAEKPPQSQSTIYQLQGGALPASVEFTKDFGPIEKQAFEDCTAFAGLQFFSALRVQAGYPWVVYSTMAQYFMERALEGDLNQDNGAKQSSILSVLERYGPMPLVDDPYVAADLDTVPPPGDWLTSIRLIAQQVASLPMINGSYVPAMKDALAHHHPILTGIVCFDEIEGPEVEKTGLLPLPANPNSPLGGHEIVACGYNDTLKFPDGSVGGVLFRNQWGVLWGLKGYFWISYAYLDRYLVDGPVTGFPPNAYPHYALTVENPTLTFPVGTHALLQFKTTTPHQSVTCDVLHIATQSRQTIITDAQGVGTLPITAAHPRTMTIQLNWIDPTQLTHAQTIYVTWVKAAPVPPATHYRHTLVATKSDKEKLATLAQGWLRGEGWDVTGEAVSGKHGTVSHTLTATKTDTAPDAKEAMAWLRDQGWSVKLHTLPALP